MMDGMSGMMGAMMLIGALVFAIAVGVAVYLAVRAAQGPAAQKLTPRESLQHRLAAGEITPEEYYERESLLPESKSRRRL